MSEEKKIIEATSIQDAKAKLGETFEKPDQKVEITQQTIKGSSEENKRLRHVGDLLCPDGLEYVGSIATHIYRRNKLDGSFNTEIRTQCCLDEKIIKAEVSFGLYATSVDVAKRYGFELNKNQRAHIVEE